MAEISNAEESTERGKQFYNIKTHSGNLAQGAENFLLLIVSCFLSDCLVCLVSYSLSCFTYEWNVFFFTLRTPFFRGDSCNLLISNRNCTSKWVRYLGGSAAHFGAAIEGKKCLSACCHVVWIAVLPEASRVSSTWEISIWTVFYTQLQLYFLQAFLAAEDCLRLQLSITCWRIRRPLSDEWTQGFALSPGSQFYRL